MSVNPKDVQMLHWQAKCQTAIFSDMGKVYQLTIFSECMCPFASGPQYSSLDDLNGQRAEGN